MPDPVDTGWIDGPWVYVGAVGYGYGIRNLYGDVAVVHGANGKGRNRALLMAHAPYLLEAAEKLLAVMPANGLDDDDPEQRHAWAFALGLIEKIRRETRDIPSTP